MNSKVRSIAIAMSSYASLICSLGTGHQRRCMGWSKLNRVSNSVLQLPAKLVSTSFQNERKKKMKITGAQVKAARDLLKITQPELARASGVSERTIAGFEADENIPKPANLARILGELERRGIEFTNGAGIGVRLIFEKAAAFARLSEPRAKDSGG